MSKLESHIQKIIDIKLDQKNWEVPKDYFNWGRDKRHQVDDTETLSSIPSPKSLLKKIAIKIILISFLRNNKKFILFRFRRRFKEFSKSYELMSDEKSKILFAELILMLLVSEHKMRLSSFSKDFISSYEKASEKILNSHDCLQVYTWILRKVALERPSISLYTAPTMLNHHYTGRLYRYQNEENIIEVEGGDVVIDAGVGWGDTTIYLAALANEGLGGHSYAFDVLEEGMSALEEQRKLNPHIKNITPVLKALSDKDNEDVYITDPSPGAKVINRKTERKVKTISIDTFVEENKIDKVDFIKMDIEGAEVSALTGAARTIKKYKPKLAISVYHKWDDLLVIPQLIHEIRDDYNYYLDCTTGFGGEVILYCR